MSEGWTVGRVVRWAADDFRARGIESPRLEAELLLAHALGTDRMRIIVESDRDLADDELARYRALIQRRRKGEPVAYLRGYKEFYGRSFRVDERVLVPRADTEILVETALARTADRSMGRRYLDLCTGSGCVAISLARERPSCKVFAVDASEAALVVARDNGLRLGAAAQVAWLAGDLYEPLGSFPGVVFDLVTANPPYIPEGELASLSVDIRGFEPRLALSGGEDGLDVMRRIVRDAPRFLRRGGVLAVEMGMGQASRVQALFEEAGFGGVRIDKDYGGHDRVASGVLP
jgi:release factor glutamine methyltransferase